MIYPRIICLEVSVEEHSVEMRLCTERTSWKRYLLTFGFRLILHPLIDLEQVAVVHLVCTRMQKKIIPALSVCLCGSQIE